MEGRPVDSIFFWLTRSVSAWFWLRVASGRNEHHVGRWFVSVLALVLIVGPLLLWGHGHGSLLLVPVALAGLALAAFQGKNLLYRIYSGKVPYEDR